MSKPSRFLSWDIDWRRVAAAVFTAAALGVGLLLALGRVWPALAAEFLVSWAMGYVWLRSWARRRAIADLPGGAPAFRVFLPGSLLTTWGFATAGLIMLTAFCGVVIELYKIAPESHGKEIWLCLAPLALGATAALGCALALAGELRRHAPLLLAAEEGMLVIQYPFKKTRLALVGLQAQRIVSSDKGRLLGLRLDAGENPVCIYAREGFPHEQRFLRQLCEWLETRGLAFGLQEQTIDGSACRLLALAVIFAGSIALCMLLPKGVIPAAVFWIQWMTQGALDPMVAVQWMLAIPLAGVALILSPLRGWLWKLVQYAQPRSGVPPDAIRITATESLQPPGVWRSFSREGFLSLTEQSLVLSLGQSRWRIQRDALRVMKPQERMEAALMGEGKRFLGRPTVLSWTGEEGTAHSILVSAAHGWSFGRDRRLDRKIYEALDQWRHGERADGLAGLKPGPRWLAPALAVVLLVVGFAVPLVHNHLLQAYVHTGRWLPPARIQPQNPLGPEFPSPQAVHSGPMVLGETSRDPSNCWGELIWALRKWVGDPVQKSYRVIPFDFYAVPSYPGPITHVLFPEDIWRWLKMAPIRRKVPGRDFPPQIISVETGRAREISSFPRKPDPSGLALFRDERIFYAIQAWPQSSTHDIGWIDAANDRCHPLGRMEIKGFSTPLFFPAGQAVLLDWTVVDLQTGTRKSVKRPEAPEEKTSPTIHLGLPWLDAFPAGERLRLRVVYGEKPPYRREVWEIDPASAQCEVIARLPENTFLCSADGDRWLLVEKVSETDELIVKLHDHATSQTRTLFREPRKHYALIAGEPRMLSWSEKEGWSVRSIE